MNGTAGVEPAGPSPANRALSGLLQTVTRTPGGIYNPAEDPDNGEAHPGGFPKSPTTNLAGSILSLDDVAEATVGSQTQHPAYSR